MGGTFEKVEDRNCNHVDTDDHGEHHVADTTDRDRGDETCQQRDADRKAEPVGNTDGISLSPGEQRADAHRQKKPKAERHRQSVEKGLAYGNAVSAEGLDHDGIQRARDHDERIHGEQQIVEEEPALPADEALEAIRLFEQRNPPREQGKRPHHDEEEKPQKHRADGRLGERVD